MEICVRCGNRNLSKVKILQKGHTMILHHYTLQPKHQDFKDQGHYEKVKDQIEVTSLNCIPTPTTNICTKYQRLYTLSLHVDLSGLAVSMFVI